MIVKLLVTLKNNTVSVVNMHTMRRVYQSRGHNSHQRGWRRLQVQQL
jgi:hypothetical protein